MNIWADFSDNDLFIEREDVIQEMHYLDYDDPMYERLETVLCSIEQELDRRADSDGPDEDYDYEDHLSDVEADADTLASAGWGTDEDYSYFGGDEW
ncbi:MAG: hypothetical protein VW333_05840 [Pseudomonadales bacterium]|jgi:hypothetical protein